MDELFVQALVGFGQLTLIMMVSALLIGFGYMVKQAVFGKSCDKK